MELEGIYTNDSDTCSLYNERGLDRDEDIANEDQKLSQSKSRAQKHSLPGGSKCVVLSTVCFSLVCVLLVVTIIVLHIKLKTEREIQATHMLQTGSRYQTEKDQLQSSFNSVSQNKLELETRISDLTAKKGQLQNSLNSLSQNKLELETKINYLTAEKSQLETRVNNLTAEKSQLQNNFNSLSQTKLELETRVNNLTAEKSQLETRFNNLTAEKGQLQNGFISLSQTKLELETRVNNLTAEKSQLQDSFNSLSQTKLELETRVNNLTAEKGQLQNSFNSLSQKKLELETRVNDLTTEKGLLQRNFDSLNQKKLELETELRKLCKAGNGKLVINRALMSWSESRQYCRDHGGDLAIINSEEKQRKISSFNERVWIGLSDIETERRMKWVDDSPLMRGFWIRGEPNDQSGKEDCIELMPEYPVLNNWNDLPCAEKRKGICETC